ncbi:protein TRANSPARENT TESTA 12-like [Pyrus ussuriensis x Pyrus communis]|uniref:Protein TRANSPARENT TESTA 12-like n=1 Tax=Pyrus ussuriensis x Pyrus communis TaxID=2448454 RepID=A0A5N5F649_9ROSA|nr:protein TRANSPARENT TESTA 12-like [Pyrus ussuriensis x Pyrus communis]
MQRSWIVLFIACIILSPVFNFAAPILKFLGQEHGIADPAGVYSLKIIPQMFSYAINLPTQRFHQAQSKVLVITLIAFAALIVQTGLLHLFINVFGLGTTGAAVAYDITNWGVAISQVGYVMVCCKEEWTGFSRLAFGEIWDFAKLSLASCMMVCLDLWYPISISILAGLLPNAVISVGSFSICMNFQNWEIMLLLGISAAVSYYLVGLPLAIFLGFKVDLGAIFFLLIMTCRTNWDREVEQTTRRIKKWRSQETITDEICI